MKNLVITLSLLICIAQSISVSGQSKSRRTSSRSSAAKGSVSREQALNNEAHKLANQYWDKLIKCGTSYFLYSDDRLFEFRDKPHFSFSGQVLNPRPLSRVEILNRVDPLPIEWDGSTNVSFEVCRMNTSHSELTGAYGYGRTLWDRWGNWTSQHCGFGTRISREKRKWNISALKQISCADLAGWRLIPKVAARTANGSPTKVIRVDSSKEWILCGPNQPFEQCKPNPLTLVVRVKDGGTVFLNNEPQGTLRNPVILTRKLTQLFRMREQQHAYRLGTTAIEATVWINTDGGFLTEPNLQKLVNAIKLSGADPIKITDEAGSFGPDARPSVIKNPALPVQATLVDDPALIPLDMRQVDLPKSKSPLPATQIVRVDSSKEWIIGGPNVDITNLKPNPQILVVTVEGGNNLFLNNEPGGTLINPSLLTRKLTELFRARRQEAFHRGSKEVETTVWITTFRSPLAESDLQKIIQAIKIAGANPIKITDQNSPILPSDPNLVVPPDTVLIEYPAAKPKSPKPPE